MMHRLLPRLQVPLSSSTVGAGTSLAGSEGYEMAYLQVSCGRCACHARDAWGGLMRSRSLLMGMTLPGGSMHSKW